MRTAVGAVLLLSALPVSAQQAGPWRQYANAADAGFSVERLEAARRYADSVRSGAVMAVHRGSVLVAWGDVTRSMPLHSVRKSLLSALYGIAIERGELRLTWTLADAGIDDDAGLTAAEKRATLRDIISARSGVYLPAAYAASDQDDTRPARGSHAPGAHWFYNNWDFNVAGVIYERATGRNVYVAFDSLMARVLGMEDYVAADGLVVLEPSRSRHPAHTFSLSARDLARFGQLYLQEGVWGGRQVVPAWWVRESTRPHSDLGDGTGYGYMWWTYAPGSLGASYPHLDRHALYMGRGTGGQAVFVIPAAELVIVHRGDTENRRSVSGAQVWQIAERILAAREGEPKSDPATIALTPTSLASQLPEAVLPPLLEMDAASLARLVGEYEMASGATIRVFLHEGRPFINVPGEGEAEMYAIGANEFILRVEPGVGIRFETDGAGTVTGVLLRMGAQELRGTRRGAVPGAVG